VLVTLTVACGHVDTPVTDGTLVPINGTELFVRRIGSGDPIVVVHGGPMLEHGSLLPHLELYVPHDYAERSRQFGFMMKDLMSFDFTADLSAVTVPALIVYGDIEPAAGISGPSLDKALPNSELFVVQHSGHFPFIEQRQATMDVILDFLSKR
jgi:pimeloyl-ACP methyl ester carboxylesterase